MEKPAKNIFAQLKFFEEEIESLEARIIHLEKKLDLALKVERNHLMRIKNNEDISDDFIFSGRKFLDLSPEKAFKIYQNKDFDFIIIDVSSDDFPKERRLKGAMHIPWEDFQERFLEINNQMTPLLIISEDGTNSVLACEFLVKHGFFNCNNVSGGYKFWVGSRMEAIRGKSA
jgi:rhodanese-related sulfurtransferase